MLQTKVYKLEQLKLNKDNPRVDLSKHDPIFKELVQSIKKFGYVVPIIVNKTTGNVVAGHLRIKALKELKIKEVEVIEIEIPKEKEAGLVIALNSIKGDWDINKLQDLVANLDAKRVNFVGTGFNPVELRVLLNQAADMKQLKKLLNDGTKTNLEIKWSCSIGACSFKISDALYKAIMDLIDKKKIDPNKIIEAGL